MNKLLSVIVATAAFAAVSTAEARDNIQIVGSSTVFPFSSSVAEQFGNKTEFGTPVVESTGSGGGMKLFCAGVGTKHPDVTNASRRIKKSEFDTCSSNGIKMTEVQIGSDGIVLANSTDSDKMSFTLDQIFKAFAERVVIGGRLVTNPYKKWSNIDPSLPDSNIEAFGPPPTSGTRDAFVEIAMEKGANTIPALSALRALGKDAAGIAEARSTVQAMGASEACIAAANGGGKKAFQCIAHSLREDGAWIDAGENDNAIVQTLVQNPTAVGVFGFSFLDQNGDRIQGSSIGGVDPTFETISAGEYPVARKLYFYVKHQHIGVVPGVKEYAAEFVSNDAIGPEGYAVDKGLIPLPADQLAEMQARVTDVVEFNGAGL